MEIWWRFSCLSLHKDPSAGSHWFGSSCEKMDTQSEGGICPDPSFSSSTGICRLVMPRFGTLISVLVSKRQVQKILQLIHSLFPPPLQLKWQKHRTRRRPLSAPKTACMTATFSSPVEIKNYAQTFSSECPRAQKPTLYQPCQGFCPVVAQCNWGAVIGIKFPAS